MHAVDRFKKEQEKNPYTPKQKFRDPFVRR